jgi:hypothetical protein
MRPSVESVAGFHGGAVLLPCLDVDADADASEGPSIRALALSARLLLLSPAGSSDGDAPLSLFVALVLTTRAANAFETVERAVSRVVQKVECCVRADLIGCMHLICCIHRGTRAHVTRHNLMSYVKLTQCDFERNE